MWPRKKWTQNKTGYYLSFKIETLTVTKIKASISLFLKQYEWYLSYSELLIFLYIEEYSIKKNISCHLKKSFFTYDCGSWFVTDTKQACWFFSVYSLKPLKIICHVWLKNVIISCKQCSYRIQNTMCWWFQGRNCACTNPFLYMHSCNIKDEIFTVWSTMF